MLYMAEIKMEPLVQLAVDETLDIAQEKRMAIRIAREQWTKATYSMPCSIPLVVPEATWHESRSQDLCILPSC